MGKKHKHLFDSVTAFDNLWLASRKARLGKRHRPEVLDFEYNLEANLFQIQEQLIDETYVFSPYRHFTIYEPKKREISAAPYRDRVVHHALCNVIEPILDKAMIFDSYACRRGKGMHSALDRAQQFMRANSWALKIDIRKYFFTIDHEILTEDIQKKITDIRVMGLIRKILDSYQSSSRYYLPMLGDDLFSVIRKRGLPIGNLTSQLFANYYLTSIDRFIKENLKISSYLRYMDDMLIFANSKSDLSDIKVETNQQLLKKRLLMHPDKSQVFPMQNGVRYLGFTVFSHYRRIRRENLQRFKKKFKERIWQYEHRDIAMENLLLSLNAWLGFADKQTHGRLLNSIFDNMPVHHPMRGYDFRFFIPGGQS